MSLREEKSTRKSKPNYITAVISITLVLLNLGILAVALLLSKDLPNSVKENLEFQIELRDDISKSELSAFTLEVEKKDYAKSIEYVSKEDASKIMQEELGEDFKGLLGYNPLYASLNLKIKSDFLVNDEILTIEEDLKKSGYVQSINYDGELLKIINNYAGKIIFPLIGFAILLFIIALFLIDSTIRLSMYSKRFLVRSMKLVGATEWFIAKPFIKSGIMIGMVSGVLASVILMSLVFPLTKYFLNISMLDNIFNYIAIVVFLIVLGVLISVLSTKRAVNKYLKLKLNDLY
jgi:cell division transport system permease protein